MIFSFIENILKFYEKSGKYFVRILCKVFQIIFNLSDFARIVEYNKQIIEKYIEILKFGNFGIFEIRKKDNLNLKFDIKIYIIVI